MKACSLCGKRKEYSDFPINKTRSDGFGYICKECQRSYARKHYYANRQYYRDKASKLNGDPRAVAMANARSRAHRSRLSVAQLIVLDSKKSDRKRGRENTLELEHVEDLIAQGCSYCGERNMRMTLDRIDNNLGHVHDNVIAACIRCNYLRRDIPYSAWLILVPAIREVVRRGLFGTWTGRCDNTRK